MLFHCPSWQMELVPLCICPLLASCLDLSEQSTRWHYWRKTEKYQSDIGFKFLILHIIWLSHIILSIFSTFFTDSPLFYAIPNNYYFKIIFPSLSVRSYSSCFYSFGYPYNFTRYLTKYKVNPFSNTIQNLEPLNPMIPL